MREHFICLYLPVMIRDVDRDDVSSARNGTIALSGLGDLSPPGNDRQDLGVRLRGVLTKRGWTYEDLARATRHSPRSVGSWVRQGPPASKVDLIDHVLGGELLGPREMTVRHPGGTETVLTPLLELLNDLQTRLTALEMRLTDAPHETVRAAR